MIKKVALLCLFLVTAGANAINFADNAVIKTAQNFLEQPGATLTDAAVYIACASTVYIVEYIKLNNTREENEKTNNVISALGFPFVSLTPWVIRGFPSYKWFAPFMPIVSNALTLQHGALPTIARTSAATLAGYAGLLAKNIITRCIKK